MSVYKLHRKYVGGHHETNYDIEKEDQEDGQTSLRLTERVSVLFLTKSTHDHLTCDVSFFRRPHTTLTVTMTSMIAARTVARFHPLCRRAMMSAWSTRRTTTPQPQPSLHDSPPIVIPTSNTHLRPDTASPQTAAPPPPAPKAARPKPTIRAQKAALSLVSEQNVVPCLQT